MKNDEWNTKRLALETSAVTAVQRLIEHVGANAGTLTMPGGLIVFGPPEAIRDLTQGCQCPECKITPHLSSCAVHNLPAFPKGPCDCGAIKK